MERSDERLSTRDIASGGSADTEAERDTAAADHTDAEPADGDSGAVAADETTQGRGPSPEAVGDAPAADTRSETGAASSPTPAAAAVADGGRTDGGTADRDERDEAAGPLLDDADELQRRWEEIQVRFVDEPRGAVEDADALVATVMQRLADSFASERERLEAQWGRGEDIGTEDLRVTLQRYRSFFRRLLAT